MTGGTRAAVVAWLVVAAVGSAAEVTGLRCEHRVNPLAVDAPRPRLTWRLASAARGERQTAYRVLVASSPDALAADRGDLWDSGRVASDQSVLVPYAGRPLAARQRCWWKVRVWDRDGSPSAWSTPAEWTVGLLNPADWAARWIAAAGTPPPPAAGLQLRKEFTLDRPVRRALLSACGLGVCELSLNGRKVGDEVLGPGWTDYRKTCLYTTHDVTAHLAPGPNALGVMLGNGMYTVPGGRYVKFTGSFGRPQVILHLAVEYADGTRTAVASDGSWTWAAGPVVFNCVFGGEDHDARRETPGWDRPGFDARGWQAVGVGDGPGGRLAAQAAPPVKVMRQYPPARVTHPKPGVTVYDFGQNCSSQPHLKVQGPAGASVRLTPGELLDDRGLVTQRSSGGPSYYTYTLRGGGPEEWAPRFFYYGSRYLQVETSGRMPGEEPRVLGLTSRFAHAAAEPAGEFSCSDPLVNRVHDLILAAVRSNLQSVLTDCPHREKLGWLECAHLLAGCLTANYELPTFYAKVANDMREAQLASGLVPDIAPEYTVFQGGFRDSPEWGSACVIVPWQVYQTYGDRSLLETHYDVMKRYAAYLASRAKDHIVSHGLGDWYDIGPGGPGESQLTSRGVTATAIYYQDLLILREAAALLGRADEAKDFAARAEQVRAAFNRAFFHPETNTYDRNSQTANAMPLVLGLVPEDRRAAVLDGLVAGIRAGGYRVTAGDVGFHYLVRALSDAGRGDVLYEMVRRDDGPGYAYQLRQGATSLTEAWDTNPGSSQNHCMLGHVEEWLHRGLGGLAGDPAGPGFRRMVVRPQVVGDLKSARVRYQSPYGPVASAWERDGGTLRLEVVVPPNATATVYVPSAGGAVTEGGQPAEKAAGVKFLRREGGAAVYEVGSGTYHFAAQR